MNKFVASACAVAAGATSASAVNSFDLSQAETAKPWSVEVATRALYDSNPYNKPDADTSAKDSFGVWVIPKIGVNFVRDQIFLGARYTYDARYYERFSKADQSHEVEGIMNYKPSERIEVTARDSFAYSDQPSITQGSGTQSTYRADQSSFRNRGEFSLKAAATRDLLVGAGYYSTVYDYDEAGKPGSYSSLLDRNENLFNVNVTKKLSPGLSIGPGYQFGLVNYTGNDFIKAGGLKSDSRNNYTHYGYLEVDYALSSKLNLSVRGGAMYTHYDSYSSEDGWNPYGSVTLKYSYMRDCSVELGFIHTMSATDVANVAADNTPTLSQEASSIYLNVEHRLSHHIWANLWTQAQTAQFTGGAFNSQNENYVWVAPTLDYRCDVRPFGLLVHLTPQVGYAFQSLTSDAQGRDFSRHTVYIGLKATY